MIYSENLEDVYNVIEIEMKQLIIINGHPYRGNTSYLSTRMLTFIWEEFYYIVIYYVFFVISIFSIIS